MARSSIALAILLVGCAGATPLDAPTVDETPTPVVVEQSVTIESAIPEIVAPETPTLQ